MGRREDGWPADKRRTSVMSDNHETQPGSCDDSYRKLPGVNKLLAYAPRGIVTDYTNAEHQTSYDLKCI